MLHVFLVDIGLMLKLDMVLAAEKVLTMMKELQRMVHIPPNKQVLLTSSGLPLVPDNIVASYASAGTETQPIFLFSKATIESSVPPSPSVNLGSEVSLKEEVEKSLKMKPEYNTLLTRAKLAMVFQQNAIELYENCENLVSDQMLQRDGWNAVMFNLDQIVSAFVKNMENFDQIFKTFIETQQHYHNVLQSFDRVVSVLNQLPLLSCLKKNNQPYEETTLLEWIGSQDKQSSLDHLVHQCEQALMKYNSSAIELLFEDARKIINQANNTSMKEIRGLDERISSLHDRLIMVKQTVEDQKGMAQAFQQNQMRAEHVRDASVLPDLCASHQKQLLLLLRNHHQIREVRNLCAKSKDELGSNLHARLRWVMVIQRSVCEIDSKVLIYQESIKRIKKRLDIIEQIGEAPKMYVLAILEVLRRRNFSQQFSKWMTSVAQSSKDARLEELEKRNNFHKILANHFVKNLFPGLGRYPDPFAEDVPISCDSMLPEVTNKDVQYIQQAAPEIMIELNFTQPLDSSVLLNDCLSQSNLSKLIKPTQNTENVGLRQELRASASDMTMSVLKREMFSDDIEFPFPQNIQFNVGSASDQGDNKDILESDFEPESLSSLASDKKMNNSSDSEALFMSAEIGLPTSATSSFMEKSSSSLPGKSSSSPIAIQSNSRSPRLFQSFSPEISSPPQIKISSADCYTSQSGVNILQHSRSLSEALKADENKTDIPLQQSTIKNLHYLITNLKSEVKNMMHEIKQLLNQSDINVSETQDYILGFINKYLKNELSPIKKETDCLKKENSLLKESLLLSKQENEELHANVNELSKNIDQLEQNKDDCNEINSSFVKEIEELKKKNDCLISEKGLISNDLNNKNINVNELTEQFNILQNELNKKEKEQEILAKEFSDFKDSTQSIIDEHLNHVSNVNLQVKELKKVLAEKEQQLSITHQQKDDLELQKQSNFNFVINKVKREKDDQIKELNSRINDLTKDIESRKLKNDAFLHEINAHKEAYTIIEENYKNVNSLKHDLLQQIDNLNKEIKDINASHKNEITELNDVIENMKKEKLKVIQELKVQYDTELEKEKKSILLQMELEKEAVVEEMKRTHSVEIPLLPTKSVSIEEGIDELEISQLLEQVKKLRIENESLKAISSCGASGSGDIKENGTYNQIVKKLELLEIDVGSLIILYHDPSINQYCALSVGKEKYFLHPESKRVVVNHLLGKEEEKRLWMFAVVLDKEYCITKKAQNKFNLPIGSYFTRIQVKPFDDK